MGLWVPGQSRPQRASQPTPPKAPEPPPQPNEQETISAEEVADVINEKLTTHAARIALLQQPKVQQMLAEWMNVVLPAFAPQLVTLDRQQMLVSIQETLKDEQMKAELQGFNVHLEPQTLQSVLNVYVHIAQRLPPPVFQLQVQNNPPTGASESQEANVHPTGEGEPKKTSTADSQEDGM